MAGRYFERLGKTMGVVKIANGTGLLLKKSIKRKLFKRVCFHCFNDVKMLVAPAR